MKIKDRPEFKSKPEPFVLNAGELAATAIQVMSKRNIGSVILVDDDRRVAGIVTERDLLRRLLGERLDQQTTPLSAIMTTEVRTAKLDDEVVDWLRLMSNERFRHLPVVDNDGKLINVLSQGDFVSYTWPQLIGNVKEKAAETFRSPSAQIPILIGALMVYTLVMVAIFKLI
jgi:CBS domain-containing protein